MSTIQALIFDFDGLILDTELPAYRSWQEIYEEHGCHLPLPMWATRIGTNTNPFDPLDYLEARCGRPVDRKGLTDRRERRRAELIRMESLRPGLDIYLAEADRVGLKLAVASSSSRAFVSTQLEWLGLLDRFSCIKCAEDVARTKPDPALYQAALDTLGILPSEAIALEDSPNGVLAARQAGIFCVAVPCSLTAQLNIDHANLTVASLADLPFKELLSLVEKSVL
ncbi:MAG: HAD-IA family hydrolase [Dehalococcoidia bacterium]|nr:HAD-IA family hydrolase [Dehalococcoidia bacterium]